MLPKTNLNSVVVNLVPVSVVEQLPVVAIASVQILHACRVVSGFCAAVVHLNNKSHPFQTEQPQKLTTSA